MVALNMSPDLWAMAPRAQTIALEWFEAGVSVGYADGVAQGRQAAEQELAAIQRAAVASARVTANSVPFDVLAERRGEHDRAAAHRALLRERGVA